MAYGTHRGMSAAGPVVSAALFVFKCDEHCVGCLRVAAHAANDDSQAVVDNTHVTQGGVVAPSCHAPPPTPPPHTCNERMSSANQLWLTNYV